MECDLGINQDDDMVGADALIRWQLDSDDEGVLGDHIWWIPSLFVYNVSDQKEGYLKLFQN